MNFFWHSMKETLGEPWVALPDEQELSNWGDEKRIAFNQSNRQVEKFCFYLRAFDFLVDNRIGGDYMEFGCHRARTFRMALSAARIHMQDKMNFYAFDSFEGLPDPTTKNDVEFWVKGFLKTDIEAFKSLINDHGIYTKQVECIKGYYDTSLPENMGYFVEKGARAALINIDCDFYESAVPVFDFIENFLQEGTVIYIDDLFAGHKGNPTRGVYLAFEEFQERTSWRFVQHDQIGWWGRSFIAYR